jgi:HK97 gp10 family phage protein
MSFTTGGGGKSAASQFQSIANSVLQRYNESVISSILQQAGKEGVDAARARTPVRTGRLRDGNAADVSGLTLRFHNDVEYAGYVNDGTSRMSPTNFFDAGVEAIKNRLDEEFKKL